MKKTFLKILFCTIAFIMILAIKNMVKANTIDSVNIVINLSQDGVGHVSEEWQTSLDEGTEIKHSFKNLGDCKISNFKVVDEFGNNFTEEKNWKSNDNIEINKQKCAMVNTTDGVDLYWGIGQYGSNAYFLEYDITNFVSNLKDQNQMIYFEFFQKGREEIRHVGINIASEDTLFTNIAEVWGYGSDNGLYQINAIGEIYYSSLGKLETNESVIMLVRFNPNTFTNITNSINHDISYYEKKVDKKDTGILTNKGIILALLIFILAGIAIFIFLNIRKKETNKTRKKCKNSQLH